MNPSFPFLRDRLTAIKRRRPDARIAEPEGVLARRLLHEVFGLPNKVDPLEWLEVERGDVVVGLALGILMERAVRLYGPGSPRLDSGSARTAMVGRIRQGRVDSFTQDDSPQTPAWVARLHSELDIEEMLKDFRVLRNQTGEASETSTQSSGTAGSPRALLNELIRLTDDQEPTEWFRTRHASLCSEIVLDHLLTSLMPVERMYRDAAMLSCGKPRPLRVKALSTGRIKIDIHDLVMIEHGFVLKVRCRFRRNRGMDSPMQGAVVRWDGFRQVTDDAGRSYVPFPIVNTSNRLWWQAQEMVIICWPVIEDDIELTFTSKPAYLSIYRPSSLHGELLYQQGPDIGDISYRVSG
ncbi:MAG: hypothetical protein OXC95_06490 [Dehalococcoidia bacterium]|nr:hypothetical protein [Dehalococcoidia bacterium]